jgi:hypothetical protein
MWGQTLVKAQFLIVEGWMANGNDGPYLAENRRFATLTELRAGTRFNPTLILKKDAVLHFFR